MSNDRIENNSSRYINIIVIGIFLIEIIIDIIGVFILPAKTEYLILLTSVIFMSGIYAIVNKTLLYLSAFCVVNTIPSIILIGIIKDDIDSYRSSWKKHLNSPNPLPDIILDVLSQTKKRYLVEEYFEKFLAKSTTLQPEKEYITTFIIPNIVASALNAFFVVLFIILLIIIWRKKYWNVVSYPKITIPEILKKPYITYEIHGFLLYITLYHIFVFDCISSYRIFIAAGFTSNAINAIAISTTQPIMCIITFLLFNILIFSSAIIKHEKKTCIFLIYSALILQGAPVGLYIGSSLSSYNMEDMFIFSIVTLTLLGSLFINTILCHRNFGNDLKLYLILDPDESKEYKYSNDMSSDNDIVKIDEDEMAIDTLKRYRDNIKSSFQNFWD